MRRLGQTMLKVAPLGKRNLKAGFTRTPGNVPPSYRRASLQENSPLASGFAFGYAPLGSFLAGAIAAGALMAVFLANSGGAWDNAKKLVEDGHHGGKGSDAHAATVIGDTVGDPFKDTSGPSMNILLKVMTIVSLVFASAFV